MPHVHAAVLLALGAFLGSWIWLNFASLGVAADYPPAVRRWIRIRAVAGLASGGVAVLVAARVNWPEQLPAIPGLMATVAGGISLGAFLIASLLVVRCQRRGPVDSPSGWEPPAVASDGF